MTLRLYMDVHVRDEITDALRLRGVDVLTAQEDGTARLDDPALLDRATGLGRVLFTQDQDFLVETSARQHSGRHFAGVIYAHQLNITIGQCIDELELVAKVYEPVDISDQMLYLPL